MPNGMVKRSVRSVRKNVPIIAGNIPPPVIPCSGLESKNSKLSTGTPIQARYPISRKTADIISAMLNPRIKNAIL
jgi:hypothetical protein